jgi:hypothetical protein
MILFFPNEPPLVYIVHLDADSVLILAGDLGSYAKKTTEIKKNEIYCSITK